MSLSRDVEWLRQRIDALERTVAIRDEEAAQLRARLRQVLNCTDPKCSVCARCLAAVRDVDAA